MNDNHPDSDLIILQRDYESRRRFIEIMKKINGPMGKVEPGEYQPIRAGDVVEG